MVGKKGAAIITIILGSIVILLLIYGIGNVGYQFAKEKIFGERGVLAGKFPAKEFVPGVSPIEDDELIAINSMKALVCAINSMAAGKPGWEMTPSLCPDGFTILKTGAAPAQPSPADIAKAPAQPATGKVVALTGMAAQTPACNGDIAYGTTCVECTETSSILRPITLDSNKQNAINQIVDETLRCYQKFKENNYNNVYCSQVTVPKSGLAGITMAEYRDALSASGPLGADMASYWKRDYEWNIESPLASGAKDFYLCAENRLLGNKVLLTRDLLACPLSASAYHAKRLECTVRSFELPQKVSVAEELIVGSGDPKFLAYYEKFPEGEEKAWQYSSKTVFFVVLGVQGALTMLPLGGKAAFALLKKVVKISDAVTRTSKNIQRLLVGFDKLSDAQKQARAIKIQGYLDNLEKLGFLTDGLRDLVKVSMKGINSLPAESIIDDVANRLMSRIQGIKNNIESINIAEAKIVKGNLFNPSLFDEARIPVSGTFTDAGKELLRREIKTIAGDAKIAMTDSQVDELIKMAEMPAGKPGLASANDVANYLRSSAVNAEDAAIRALGQADLSTVGLLMRRVGFKKGIKALLKEGTLEKPLTDAVKGLKALKKTDPGMYETMIKQADELASSYVDDLGNINFQALLDDSSESALSKLLMSVDDAGKPTAYGVQVDEMRDLLSAKTWGKGLWAGTIQKAGGPLPAGTTPQMLKEFIKNQARSLGCVIPAGVGVGLGAEASKVKPEAGVAVGAGGALLAGLATGTVGTCAKFVRDHYFPILVGLSYFMALEDSKNQKFIGVGKNTYGLIKPLAPQLTKKYTFDTPGSDHYYSEMLKEDDSRVRFFAASPCKADYDMLATYRGCAFWHNEYIYNFTDAKGIVRLQGIEPIAGKGNITIVRAWDKMDSKQKVSYLIDGSKGFWSQSRGPYWDSPFDGIRTAIREDPLAFKEFGEIVFTDPETFVRSLKVQPFTLAAGLKGVDLRRAGFDQVKNLTPEQFIDFRTALLNKLSVQDFSPAYPLGGDISLAPGRDENSVLYYTLEDWWTSLGSGASAGAHIFNPNAHPFIDLFIFKKCELKPGIACPWKNPNAPYEKLEINWDELDKAVQKEYAANRDSAEMAYFARMLAFKVYNTKWFIDTANESSLTYHYYNGDTATAVKLCHESAAPSPTQSNRGTRLDLTTTIPAFIIIPRNIDASYNNGNNYCFTAKSGLVKAVDTTLTIASIAAGLALTGMTAGTAAGATALFVATAVDVAGMATAYILEMCAAWPHHTASIAGCF